MNEPHLLQELRQYLSAVHKRRWLTLTSVAVALLGATLYNSTTRPLFRATAQIQILIDRDAPRACWPNPKLAIRPWPMRIWATCAPARGAERPRTRSRAPRTTGPRRSAPPRRP